MPEPERKFTPPAAWSRFIRRNLTRESIVDFLKTILWVAPLSVLIWIYADQNTSEQKQVDVKFDITLSDPDRVMTVMQSDPALKVTVRGGKTRLKALEDVLPNRTIRMELRKDAPTGPTNVNVLDYVKSSSVFRDYGMEIVNVTPEYVPVEIDKLERVSIPVIPPDDASNLVGSPIFEPREVTLTLPSKLLQAEGKQSLQAIADFSQNPEFRQPGKHEGVVPIRSSLYRPLVSLDRATVTVALEVKPNDKQTTLRRVPVKVAGYKTYLDQYGVECADVVTNIRVYGPADQIDRLADNPGPDRFEYYAVLSVDRDDKSTSKPLTFHLPPGVNVNPEDAQKPFEYRVSKRVSPQ